MDEAEPMIEKVWTTPHKNALGRRFEHWVAMPITAPRAARIGCLTVFLAVMPMATWTAQAVAGELRVSVVGVRSDSGKLRVSLFRDPASFATKAGRFMEVVIPASTANNEAVFTNVPEGAYGLAAFHDENDNVEFDENFLGIPKEGFGFGNDAAVFLGPPDFSDAAVTVDDGIKRVSLTIRYW